MNLDASGGVQPWMSTRGGLQSMRGYIAPAERRAKICPLESDSPKHFSFPQSYPLPQPPPQEAVVAVEEIFSHGHSNNSNDSSVEASWVEQLARELGGPAASLQNPTADLRDTSLGGALNERDLVELLMVANNEEEGQLLLLQQQQAWTSLQSSSAASSTSSPSAPSSGLFFDQQENGVEGPVTTTSFAQEDHAAALPVGTPESVAALDLLAEFGTLQPKDKDPCCPLPLIESLTKATNSFPSHYDDDALQKFFDITIPPINNTYLSSSGSSSVSSPHDDPSSADLSVPQISYASPSSPSSSSSTLPAHEFDSFASSSSSPPSPPSQPISSTSSPSFLTSTYSAFGMVSLEASAEAYTRRSLASDADDISNVASVSLFPPYHQLLQPHPQLPLQDHANNNNTNNINISINSNNNHQSNSKSSARGGQRKRKGSSTDEYANNNDQIDENLSPAEKQEIRAQQSREASRRYRRKKKQMITQMQEQLQKLQQEAAILLAERNKAIELLAKYKGESIARSQENIKSSSQLETERAGVLARLDMLVRSHAPDEELVPVLAELRGICKQISALGQCHINMLLSPNAAVQLAKVGFFAGQVSQVDMPTKEENITSFVHKILTEIYSVTEHQKRTIAKAIEHHYQALDELMEERQQLNNELHGHFARHTQAVMKGQHLNAHSKQDQRTLLDTVVTMQYLRDNMKQEAEVYEDTTLKILLCLTPRQQAQFYLNVEFTHQSVRQLKKMWDSMKGSLLKT
ncbi:hypothetical protein QOT17_007764 [Balamuthia mandrillaris]